jgi:hypothetical protein
VCWQTEPEEKEKGKMQLQLVHGKAEASKREKAKCANLNAGLLRSDILKFTQFAVGQTT